MALFFCSKNSSMTNRKQNQPINGSRHSKPALRKGFRTFFGFDRYVKCVYIMISVCIYHSTTHRSVVCSVFHSWKLAQKKPTTHPLSPCRNYFVWKPGLDIIIYWTIPGLDITIKQNMMFEPIIELDELIHYHWNDSETIEYFLVAIVDLSKFFWTTNNRE